MGQRGPAPKPTALRVLNGDHPNRINTDEPRPRPGVPQPPEWFTDEQLAVWHRVLDELTGMGIARSVDQEMLAAYCAAVAKWAEANRLLADEGLLVFGNSGQRTHPAAPIADAASREMSRLAREFGFTPAARVGITVAGANNNTRSQAELEEILG